MPLIERGVRFDTQLLLQMFRSTDVRKCAEQFPDGACYVVPGLAHGVNKWGSSFVDHVRYFLATQLGDWF